MDGLKVFDETSAGPRVQVIALVPVDTGRINQYIHSKRNAIDAHLQGLPTSDAWMRSPRAAKHDIVLLVKEVGYRIECQSKSPFHLFQWKGRLTSVAGVGRHSLEAVVLGKRAARPLPDAAHLTLSSQAIAVGRDRDRVPMLKAHIGTVQIDKEVIAQALGGCDRWLLANQLCSA
jgi:hypothetical protein